MPEIGADFGRGALVDIGLSGYKTGRSLARRPRSDKTGRRVLGIGLALYDALARARSRCWYSVSSLLERAPILGLQGLLGGWSYTDAQTDDARLVLRVLQDAVADGAVALNHAKVTALVRGSKLVTGVVVQDSSGRIVDCNPAAERVLHPSRDELLSTLMGTMQAPVARFVQTLNEIPARFVRTAAAVRDQKQGAQAPADAPAEAAA